MGFLAGQEVHDAMSILGRSTLNEATRIYQAFAVPVRPDRMEEAALAASVQGVLDAFITCNPKDVDGAVRATAHLVAILLYQQDDLEKATAEFMNMVKAMGREWSEDSAQGRA